MEDEIKTHSAKSCSLPQNITQSITDDIKDALKEAKELFNSILSSHGSYQRLLSIIEPSLTRFTNVPNPLSSPKLIRRAEPLSSEYERQRTLKSMSEAERESLLSESVQIERSLERELDAVKNVEKNAREVSQMVKEFTMNVVDQHEMVELVHRNVEKAKDYVDDGLQDLRKADENSRGYTLWISLMIFACAILLLLLA